MKDEELVFYLWEIDEQCRYATMAWKAMQTNDSDVQWYSVQAFLVAVANVSKILWPVKATERGERLRKMLSIADTHPFKSRGMRNAFEHSDERLDEWLSSDVKGRHLGRMSVQNGHGFIDLPHYARTYQRDTGILTFFGEVIDLLQAATEGEKLGQEAMKVAREIQNR